MDFEKYGVETFKFEILEECASDELDKKETAYMNELQPEYNIRTEGHGISEEAREKLRKLHTGKKRPTKKQREAMTGRKHTPEHCEKIRQSHLGQGWKPSTYEKRCRKIRCVETGEIFPSIKSAAEHYGLHDSNISVVLTGKKKTCGGYHWEYLDA